jgi:hypothetical protein
MQGQQQQQQNRIPDDQEKARILEDLMDDPAAYNRQILAWQRQEMEAVKAQAAAQARQEFERQYGDKFKTLETYEQQQAAAQAEAALSNEVSSIKAGFGITVDDSVLLDGLRHAEQVVRNNGRDPRDPATRAEIHGWLVKESFRLMGESAKPQASAPPAGGGQVAPVSVGKAPPKTRDVPRDDRGRFRSQPGGSEDDLSQDDWDSIVFGG